MKLLLVNSVVNQGSTGHIVEDIGLLSESKGIDCFVAFGRKSLSTSIKKIDLSKKIFILIHVLFTRLFDLHGRVSLISTLYLCNKIKKIKPDIIHLHNIHGYYLNYKILFSCISRLNIPVVWTLHDCWAYTGHCAYYTYSNCDKWKRKKCEGCKNKKLYPASLLLSNSRRNFLSKERAFTKIKKMILVTPSNWLKNEISYSFLKKYPCVVINNGINLNIFKPRLEYDNKENIILGVANVWEKRKGFLDFLELSKILDESYKIILIGLSEKQIEMLPKNIIGIKRTASQIELSSLYTQALVFVNPTYEDNFPTTNLEALACGTPVITYETGGSPEAVDEKTGFIVKTGDVEGIKNAIETVKGKSKLYYSSNCVERAKKMFNKEEKYEEYIDLYKSILKG